MKIADWTLRPWLRKLIFIAGNLAVGAVIVSGLAIPVHEFFGARSSQIAEQRVLLARLQSIAALEGMIESTSQRVTDEVKRGEFAVGANEGVVTADLQTQLKGKTEQAGARLRSAQALPTKTIDDSKLVGIRLDIQGPLQAIHRAIYAIESGKPYHFITEASLKPSPPVVVQGVPGEPVIEARLDIFVAIQIEASSR